MAQHDRASGYNQFDNSLERLTSGECQIKLRTFFPYFNVLYAKQPIPFGHLQIIPNICLAAQAGSRAHAAGQGSLFGMVIWIYIRGLLNPFRRSNC